MDEAKTVGEDIKAASMLTPRLKTAITADKLLNDSRNRIDVDTTPEIVTLTGEVYNAELRIRAETIVQKELLQANAKQTLKNELKVIN